MPLSETGSAELASALGGIAAGLTALDQGAADTVTVVVARARALAPTDTGALRKSIAGRVKGSTATIGAAVPYAAPVHSGVPSRGMKARPFLSDAVKVEQGRILDAYARDVQALIEQKV